MFKSFYQLIFGKPSANYSTNNPAVYRQDRGRLVMKTTHKQALKASFQRAFNRQPLIDEIIIYDSTIQMILAEKHF